MNGYLSLTHRPTFFFHRSHFLASQLVVELDYYYYYFFFQGCQAKYIKLNPKNNTHTHIYILLLIHEMFNFDLTYDIFLRKQKYLHKINLYIFVKKG